jgi:hypothetical protein
MHDDFARLRLCHKGDVLSTGDFPDKSAVLAYKRPNPRLVSVNFDRCYVPYDRADYPPDK